MLPLPAASVAVFAATSTVTVPVDAGVISAVKVVSPFMPVKAAAVPLPTVISPTMKSFTASLKVKVAVNGPVLVDAAVIVTVGAVLSTTKVLSFVPVGVVVTNALPAVSVMFWLFTPVVLKDSVTVSFRSPRSFVAAEDIDTW